MQGPDDGPPPLLALGGFGGRGRRRCQAEAALGQAHQGLLAGQLALEAFVLPAQGGQFPLGTGGPTSGPGLATGDQTVQGPRLDLEVARQTDAEGLGGLGRRPRPGEDLEDRRRQALGLAAGVLAQAGAAGRVPAPGLLGPGRYAK
jgi:hypothetical protein